MALIETVLAYIIMRPIIALSFAIIALWGLWIVF